MNDEKLVDAFMQHGVDVKEDVDCGDYLAKQDDSRPGVCRRVIEGHQQGGPGQRACIRITSWFARLLVIESVTSVCAGHEGASTAFLV